MNCSVRGFPPYGYIVREGQRPNFCGFLVAGFALRSKLNTEGGRQVVGIQLPGEALDFQHLYLKLADHSVQASSAASVAEISRHELQGLIEKRPNILKAVVTALLIDASIAREWLLNNGRRGARQRIAHLICEIGYRLQHHQPAGDVSKQVLPITQQQLGDATGLTSVHVNRMLKELEEGGLIGRKSGRVIMTDMARLQRVADFDPAYLHLCSSQ